MTAVSHVTPIEADMFDTIPKAAHPSPGLACAAAHAYVELIKAGRYNEIGSLFATDAIFLSPDGNIYRGRDEITGFYGKFLGHVKPEIIPLSFIGENNECIMELASRTNPEGKFRVGAIDHFTVDASGKVKRMVVFLRPAAIQELLAVTKLNASSH